MEGRDWAEGDRTAVTTEEEREKEVEEDGEGEVEEDGGEEE